MKTIHPDPQTCHACSSPAIRDDKVNHQAPIVASGFFSNLLVPDRSTGDPSTNNEVPSADEAMTVVRHAKFASRLTSKPNPFAFIFANERCDGDEAIRDRRRSADWLEHSCYRYTHSNRPTFTLPQRAADIVARKRSRATLKRMVPIAAIANNCGQTTSRPAPRKSTDCAKLV